ncbi:MAG: hypothetical protein FWB95_03275 [Treponema sp.]|nr:hypothetical protein [Treponema sp.]
MDNELSYKITESRKEIRSRTTVADVFVVILCICGLCASLYLFYKDFFATFQSLIMPPAGTVTVKYNTVQRRHNDRVVWDRLNTQSPVYSGDLVRIARLSGATLNIDDNNIELGENTLIRIQKDANLLQIQFFSGDINISSNKDSNALQLLIGEQVVKVAPGTVFNALTGDMGLVLKVTEGSAQISGENKETREIPAGTMVVQDTQGEAYYPVDAVIPPRIAPSLADSNAIAFPAQGEEKFTQDNQAEDTQDVLELMSPQQQAQLSLLSEDQLNSLSQSQLEQLASMPLTELLQFALLPADQLSQMSAEQIQQAQQEEQAQRARQEQLAYQQEQARQAELVRQAQLERERRERLARQAEEERQAQQARLAQQQWQEEQTRRARQEQLARQEQALRERQMRERQAQEEREIQEQLARQARLERERQEQQVRLERERQEQQVRLERERLEQQARQERLERERLERERLQSETQERLALDERTETDQQEPLARHETGREIQEQTEDEPQVYTARQEPLPPPAEMLPAAGMRIGASELQRQRDIEFNWSSVEGANAYIVTIYRDASPRRQQVFQSEPLSELNYTFTDYQALGENGTFFWQVEPVFYNDEGTIVRRGAASQNSFELDIPRPGRVRVRDTGVLYGR